MLQHFLIGFVASFIVSSILTGLVGHIIIRLLEEIAFVIRAVCWRAVMPITRFLARRGWFFIEIEIKPIELKLITAS